MNHVDAQAAPEPIGYAYEPELQSSKRGWFTVRREKDRYYDVPVFAAQPPAAPVETRYLQCERCGEVAIASGTLCDDCAELSIPHARLSAASDDLPCPFCGGSHVEYFVVGGHFWCRSCGATAENRKKWNTRTQPQAAQVTDDRTDYLELRASLADNITLFSHHKAALLRLVDEKITGHSEPQTSPRQSIDTDKIREFCRRFFEKDSAYDLELNALLGITNDRSHS